MAEEIPENKPTHTERVGRRFVGKKLPQEKSDALLNLGWEVAQIAKEAQLRIEDLTEMVTEFVAGRMTHDEYEERQTLYTSRWGDPFRGLVVEVRGKTDQEILNEMKERRDVRSSRRESELTR